MSGTTRLIDKTPTRRAEVSRRSFLARSGGAAALVISGSALINPAEAWGVELQAIKPGTMKTLIQMARDIYPHDHLPDRYYAAAVKGYDAAVAEDEALGALIEEGVTTLNGMAQGAFGVTYAEVGWESDRVSLLRQIDKGPFFQKIRSDLVVSIYNNQEVWPLFGYEGESASKGGYINHGFDDIDWL